MRSQVLDCLRGVAVILVLFRHYHFSFLMNKIGWIGVDLFFVLSGFLVSGLLFKEFQNRGAVDPIRFLIRRGLKIYPTFYFFLILTIMGYFVLDSIGRAHSLELSKLIYEALFIQNYIPAVWGHTWSLAVEEHFYFFLVLVVVLLVKSKRLSGSAFVFSGIAFILIIVLVLRILTWNLYSNFTFHTHLYPTHLRLDSLLFGVLISYIYHFRNDKFYFLARLYWKPALIISLILLSTPFFWSINSQWMGTIGLTLLYFAFGIVLWISVAFEKAIIATRVVMYLIRPISFIGFYSYSIYVFHTMIAVFFMPIAIKFLPELDIKILFIIYALISIAIGFLVSRVIELPFLALRDRYFKPNR